MNGGFEYTPRLEIDRGVKLGSSTVRDKLVFVQQVQYAGIQKQDDIPGSALSPAIVQCIGICPDDQVQTTIFRIYDFFHGSQYQYVMA